MRKTFLYSIIGFLIIFYFSLTVFILPEKYLSTEQLIPQPYFEVILSDTEILLGDSFRLSVVSENRGDYGDIHILSTAFPNLTEIEGIVQIITYDFTQSSVSIAPGDEIGAKYSGGLESTIAKYPSIEAMSRPILPGAKNNLELIITPEKPGIFTIYVKSIDIPHTSNRSHYPLSGILDHQNEYVLDYSVNVNP
ncbi:MAG: hypothetical protein OEL84_02625 [Nitrosopumilus sp.]|nr:hypothetical protein [Nitrosopumilus sp.]